MTNPAGSLDEHALHAPPMSAGCVLVHALHPLSQAMFRRGALEGVRFYATPDHCEALTDQHATLVAAFPSALTPLTHAVSDTKADAIDPRTTRYLLVEGERSVELPSTARTIWLRTNGATGGTPSGLDLHLVDALPPVEGTDLDTMFTEWMAASAMKETPQLTDERFHWCDLNDVSAAVALMLRDPTLEGTYHFAGRRSWSAEETWIEFNAMVQRTLAGQTGAFGSEHLTARGVPAVRTVAVSGIGDEAPRPPLGPLHAFLTEATGEGWHPKTPLRQSLMMVIAQLSERQAS